MTHPTPPHRTADQGTLTLSTAIVVPGIILLLLLAVMAGRIATAHGAVESAANEAARAASISRTTTDAAAAARSTADAILGSNLKCVSLNITSNVAGIGAPVGTPAQVTVTVTCVVRLADLTPLGQADRTITATGTSVVDPYRTRS